MTIDMADIRGLPLAKRAIEVMVAGGFNLLLHGPTGTGKTMLARRAAGLFPRLSKEAALEVADLHRGLTRSSDGVVDRVPFRAPHHTAATAGLLGGGTPVRPGEVTLAHRGLLLLDELPEFSYGCLSGVRSALADKHVRIVRRVETVFPADFQLLGAMNSCPCGNLGLADKALFLYTERRCVCPIAAVRRYQQRVALLADSFELAVFVQPLLVVDQAPMSERSESIRQRIVKAREVARQRSAGHAVESIACRMTQRAASMAWASSPDTKRQCQVRRVAQAIADLEGADEITEMHVTEALTLRQLPEYVQP